jgi:lysophospholipase L1-like esterase
VFLVVAALLVALPALLVAEALWALRGPDGVPYTQPPTTPERFGAATGAAQRLVVLGDSTAVGQGAAYRDGIAVGAAAHLGRRGPVELLNVARSGARWADVRSRQSARAARFVPDVALIAAGANDVTHLTTTGSITGDLRRTVAALRAANPDVAVVLTGSPGMGVVPRFAQPLRWVAGRRTQQVNAAITRTATELGVTLAPVAARTSAQFAADRTLFAADDFHPSARGYATWRPVIAEALDEAL